MEMIKEREYMSNDIFYKHLQDYLKFCNRFSTLQNTFNNLKVSVL